MNSINSYSSVAIEIKDVKKYFNFEKDEVEKIAIKALNTAHHISSHQPQEKSSEAHLSWSIRHYAIWENASNAYSKYQSLAKLFEETGMPEVSEIAGFLCQKLQRELPFSVNIDIVTVGSINKREIILLNRNAESNIHDFHSLKDTLVLDLSSKQLFSGGEIPQKLMELVGVDTLGRPIFKNYDPQTKSLSIEVTRHYTSSELRKGMPGSLPTLPWQKRSYEYIQGENRDVDQLCWLLDVFHFSKDDSSRKKCAEQIVKLSGDDVQQKYWLWPKDRELYKRIAYLHAQMLDFCKN